MWGVEMKNFVFQAKWDLQKVLKLFIPNPILIGNKSMDFLFSSATEIRKLFLSPQKTIVNCFIIRLSKKYYGKISAQHFATLFVAPFTTSIY